MGKIFTDEQITQIQKRCKEFVDCKIHPFDPNSENSREVFAQLIIDDERSTASSIDVCIYTHFFIDYISECVNSPVNNATYQPMLFSYRFESHSVDNIRLKQDLVKYSADNNGWFKTTIINKSNNDFETDSISGLLTLMCGTTYSTRVAISNIQPLNSDDKQIIENITAFVEKLCTKNKTFAAIKAPTPSKEEISYNVDLYKVGYANTAVITHSKNHESLLVDCGIQRTKYHTYSYYSNSEKEIKLINPEYIVISHNHFDHYNMLFNLLSVHSISTRIGTSAIKKIFMLKENINAHHIKYNYFNESLLKAYFGTKLEVIPSTPLLANASFIAAFPEVRMHMGTCTDITKCVKPKIGYLQDDSCIIITISNKKNIIFPGDCSYAFFPSTVDISNADYIVVPHHGGKVMPNPSALRTTRTDPCAFISSCYTSFYPPTAHGYVPRYDQGIYLDSKGISTKLFLQSISGNKYSFSV